MEIGTLIGMLAFSLIPANMAQKKGRSFWGYFALSVLISPLITIIVVLVLPRKNAVSNTGSTQQNQQTQQTYQAPAQQTSQPSQPRQIQQPQLPARRCPECGMSLSPEQKFCSHCGTKVSR